MNRELFSDAMNEIDSKYVEEALTYKPAKRFVFPVPEIRQRRPFSQQTGRW